jgi:hypothetical protein
MGKEFMRERVVIRFLFAYNKPAGVGSQAQFSWFGVNPAMCRLSPLYIAQSSPKDVQTAERYDWTTPNADCGIPPTAPGDQKRIF